MRCYRDAGRAVQLLEPHPWQERLVEIGRGRARRALPGQRGAGLCELAAGKADLFVTMRSSPWVTKCRSDNRFGGPAASW